MTWPEVAAGADVGDFIRPIGVSGRTNAVLTGSAVTILPSNLTHSCTTSASIGSASGLAEIDPRTPWLGPVEPHPDRTQPRARPPVRSAVCARTVRSRASPVSVGTGVRGW
jgi:hypothetical protein